MGIDRWDEVDGAPMLAGPAIEPGAGEASALRISLAPAHAWPHLPTLCEVLDAWRAIGRTLTETDPSDPMREAMLAEEGRLRGLYRTEFDRRRARRD